MNIKKHYESLYIKHGDSPEAVQWSDKDSQYKRFQILSEVDVKINSVIDIGCGLASYYEYLKNQNQSIKYLGLDFVEAFIKSCTERYKDDSNAKFAQFDLMCDSIPYGYDYIMLSGVFNNKFENNKEFMFNGIKKMFDACNRGIAFNAMSTYVDFQDDNLFYSNPLEVFDFCKRFLSKKATLRHDYLVKEFSIPFEYCIYVYK